MRPSRTSALPRALSAAAAVAACGLATQASLVLNTGTHGSTHAGNLVVNGSFEIGAPPSESQVYWATGTIFTPLAVPTGWTSSGTPDTYATWGSGGPGVGIGIRQSAPIPDGIAELYFGNSTTRVDQTPVYQADGTVTFASAPTFTPNLGGPCILEQTVHTELVLAPVYTLNFWVSGEDSLRNRSWAEGVFGLKITNVLAGDPITYLSCPSDLSASPSRRYEFFFSPINPSLPVSISFINWGHLNGITGGPSLPFATEMCLDDIIVNAPSPGTLPLLGGILLFGRRRRV